MNLPVITFDAYADKIAHGSKADYPSQAGPIRGNHLGRGRGAGLFQRIADAQTPTIIAERNNLDAAAWRAADWTDIG